MTDPRPVENPDRGPMGSDRKASVHEGRSSEDMADQGPSGRGVTFEIVEPKWMRPPFVRERMNRATENTRLRWLLAEALRTVAKMSICTCQWADDRGNGPHADSCALVEKARLERKAMKLGVGVGFGV